MDITIGIYLGTIIIIIIIAYFIGFFIDYNYGHLTSEFYERESSFFPMDTTVCQTGVSEIFEKIDILKQSFDSLTKNKSSLSIKINLKNNFNDIKCKKQLKEFFLLSEKTLLNDSVFIVNIKNEEMLQKLKNNMENILQYEEIIFVIDSFELYKEKNEI